MHAFILLSDLSAYPSFISNVRVVIACAQWGHCSRSQTRTHHCPSCRRSSPPHRRSCRGRSPIPCRPAGAARPPARAPAAERGDPSRWRRLVLHPAAGGAAGGLGLGEQRDARRVDGVREGERRRGEGRRRAPRPTQRRGGVGGRRRQQQEQRPGWCLVAGCREEEGEGQLAGAAARLLDVSGGGHSTAMLRRAQLERQRGRPPIFSARRAPRRRAIAEHRPEPAFAALGRHSPCGCGSGGSQRSAAALSVSPRAQRRERSGRAAHRRPRRVADDPRRAACRLVRRRKPASPEGRAPAPVAWRTGGDGEEGLWQSPERGVPADYRARPRDCGGVDDSTPNGAPR